MMWGCCYICIPACGGLWMSFMKKHAVVTHSRAACGVLFVTPLFSRPNSSCCRASVSIAITSSFMKLDFLFWSMTAPEYKPHLCWRCMRGSHQTGAVNSSRFESYGSEVHKLHLRHLADPSVQSNLQLFIHWQQWLPCKVSNQHIRSSFGVQ